jgi:hypothetical protein
MQQGLSLKAGHPSASQRMPIFYSFLQFNNMKIHIFWDVTRVGQVAHNVLKYQTAFMFGVKQYKENSQAEGDWVK